MARQQGKNEHERITAQFITSSVCVVLIFYWACLSTQIAHAQAPIVLSQTSVNPTNGERLLSGLVNFDVKDANGVVIETRRFKYTTPSNFATRAADTVNLWLVFHGGGGNTNTMNRYFDIIPDSAPTVLVFPEALPIGAGGSIKWRSVNIPGDETLADSYRDIIFIEQLVTDLLSANPQLHDGKVYASGFSSGGNMAWMLLCYRSKPFQGVSMFSQQLTKAKRDGGCGNGRIQDPVSLQWTIMTGYELLTGTRPDRYGYNASLPAGEQVNKTKAVFYSHGTYDDNLEYTGAAGCSTAIPPTCEASEDPVMSLDFGGPNQNRDDISTKNWLLGRHDLLDTNPAGTILPDQDPLNNNDSVATTRRTYNTSLGTPGITSRKTVRWFEMEGGVHALSALDHEGDLCSNYPPPGRSDCNTNPNASRDYETSTEVKKFFVRYGRMLQ
jgi:predicted esterase